METPTVNEARGGTNLVTRIQAGDHQAEAELVERYNHGVKIIIRRELSDAAAADDLYQEVFRIVLENIRRGDIREPERLSGFIRSITRNLIIDYFRRTVRQTGEAAIEEIEPLPHPAPSQFDELLQKESSELIQQILKRMSNERDIQVLFRFYLAEEEKEKICADLGLTRQHFNLVLHRARERFRELYEQALTDRQQTPGKVG